MRSIFWAFMILLLGAAVNWVAANNAHARATYKKQFEAKYVVANGDKDQQKYANKVMAVGCNLCHGKDAKGKNSTKVHNEYGKALKTLLAKEGKDVEKIRKTLEDVDGMKNTEGKTFGDLIRSYELPAAAI